MPFRICALAAQAAAVLQHAGAMHVKGDESAAGTGSHDDVVKAPNVLLLMADQFRFDHLSPELTPNLWKLTERGANFKKAFASAPICPAARASLLTGLSPWRHGLRGYGNIPPRYEQEMASFFKRHGYKTAAIGKNHFGTDESGARLAHGYAAFRSYEGLNEEDDYTRWFDEMRPGEDPLKSGGISCLNPGNETPPAGQWPHDDWCWNTWKSATFEYPETLHPTVWTADEAITYLSSVGKGPWFVKVSFHRPHSPYDPPERVYSATPEPGIPPATSKDGWDDEFRYNCTTTGVRDSSCGEVSPAELAQTRRAYRSAVRHVDEQAGRVLSMIDPRTTWVLFVSDHGDMQNDHYIWRKSVPYQGAVHIPMVLAWPTTSVWEQMAEPGNRYDVVELRDVFPTLVGAAELRLTARAKEMLKGLDGMDIRCSLLPDDDLICDREYVDLEHGNSNALPRSYDWNALTDGDVKYVLFADGVEQLFNITDDPREEYELARLPAYAPEVQKWRQRLAQLFEEQGRGPAWIKDGQLKSPRPPTVFSPHYPRDMKIRPTDLLLQDRVKTDKKKRIRLHRQWRQKHIVDSK